MPTTKRADKAPELTPEEIRACLELTNQPKGVQAFCKRIAKKYMTFLGYERVFPAIEQQVFLELVGVGTDNTRLQRYLRKKKVSDKFTKFVASMTLEGEKDGEQ